MKQNKHRNVKVAVLGLGYVGLPVAIAFARHHPTVGFDVSSERVVELLSGRDSTGEIDPAGLAAPNLTFAQDPGAISESNVYVVTVPTPVDDANQPDLKFLAKASETVGSVLSIGDLVIYESTVFPGATEEFCVPILEAHSGLRFNSDFMVGYSPERINPGDRTHRIDTVVKVISASSAEALDRVEELYGAIAATGTYRAASIKTAEMAKVIENTQRDLNIALMNEVAVICSKLEIDTGDVLSAARTKWNFLHFTPGLVGGHCVGVDPYYLTHKAIAIGHHPEVILAGRRINNSMPQFVAGRVKTLLLQREVSPLNSRILVLGLAFKEDCPDIRNSKAIDLVRSLQSEGATVDVYDPIVASSGTELPACIRLIRSPPRNTYDAIVLAVAHKEILQIGSQVRAFGTEKCVIFDVKHVLPREAVSARL